MFLKFGALVALLAVAANCQLPGYGPHEEEVSRKWSRGGDVHGRSTQGVDGQGFKRDDTAWRQGHKVKDVAAFDEKSARAGEQARSKWADNANWAKDRGHFFEKQVSESWDREKGQKSAWADKEASRAVSGREKSGHHDRSKAAIDEGKRSSGAGNKYRKFAEKDFGKRALDQGVVLNRPPPPQPPIVHYGHGYDQPEPLLVHSPIALPLRHVQEDNDHSQRPVVIIEQRPPPQHLIIQRHREVEPPQAHWRPITHEPRHGHSASRYDDVRPLIEYTEPILG